MHRSGHSRLRRRAWPLTLVFAAAIAFVGVAAAAAGPGAADLRIAKTGAPDPVSVGSPLAYAIQVQNVGPNTATGVVVSDRLPDGVDLLAASSSAGSCASKGKKITCELGEIGAPAVDYGSPPTVTVTVIPRRVGTIVNTATVKGDQKDPVGSNNKATATIRVVGPAALCRGLPVTIAGSPGDDAIAGTGGNDVIAGFGGNDTIVALAGRDIVCSGSGNDRVAAGSAADLIFGGAGDDRLLGRGGPDRLRGNRGNDILKGNRGFDRLRGGAGLDRCRGGTGADSVRGCER
jgi:uncharacterized repeat protein (TIGR01451 family)